jgi:hypothetical protein
MSPSRVPALLAMGFFVFPSAGRFCLLGVKLFFRYTDDMANIFSMLTSVAPRTRENFSSVWCSPRCSKFGKGERPGVTRASLQRHESSRIAAKEPPLGGASAAKEVDASSNGLWGYGRQLAPTGTCRHRPPRNGGQKESTPEGIRTPNPRFRRLQADLPKAMSV